MRNKFSENNIKQIGLCLAEPVLKIGFYMAIQALLLTIKFNIRTVNIIDKIQL